MFVSSVRLREGASGPEVCQARLEQPEAVLYLLVPSRGPKLIFVRLGIFRLTTQSYTIRVRQRLSWGFSANGPQLGGRYDPLSEGQTGRTRNSSLEKPGNLQTHLGGGGKIRLFKVLLLVVSVGQVIALVG